MTDPELVALLLAVNREGGCDTERALGLLTASGGLGSLARGTPNCFEREHGLSSDEARRLCAALELGRRAQLKRSQERGLDPMNAEAVAAWATPRLAELDHEEVWALCLDGRSALIGARQVGRGGVHGCALLARDVLVPIVREAASAFVLVHNHPSGDPTPSREDRDMTRALSRAADVVCVPLLDHVVVARGGYRSMLEMGLLEHL